MPAKPADRGASISIMLFNTDAPAVRWLMWR
jgi:hypothetical protein